MSPESLGPVGFAILAIALVAVTGLGLGSLKLRRIGLGPAGVLFTGILFGHFGVEIDHQIAGFAKEFGLVLFVFTIGLHLGPGIVVLWRKQGIVLNALALSIVVQGAAIVVALQTLTGFDPFSAAGLFSGATTNTPSLGAAVQAASRVTASEEQIESIASIYALAYPGAIVGIIATMLLLKSLFRIDPAAEAAQIRQAEQLRNELIERRTILVDNPHLAEVPFGEIPGVDEAGVRISRVQRAGEAVVHAATAETTLGPGDLAQVVGCRSAIERFMPLVGQPSEVDLMTTPGDATYRRVFVTEPRSLNRPLRELSLDLVFNATVTRIVRSGVEMTPRGSSTFHYGDIAHVVGDKEALERVARYLGDSVKSLNHTPFLPLFLGIAAGVLLGMMPFQVPGVPFPVKLGMAGGPLVAAIALSMVGRIGTCVWYIPLSANLAIRELGIILFLAAVGLGAGKSFFATALSPSGAAWIGAGALVTMVPLLTTGVVARTLLKQNYLTICGVTAGSMTDPPALAFANSLADSDACSTAYAAVYPVTMILRIVAAQGLIFLLA